MGAYLKFGSSGAEGLAVICNLPRHMRMNLKARMLSSPLPDRQRNRNAVPKNIIAQPACAKGMFNDQLTGGR